MTVNNSMCVIIPVWKATMVAGRCRDDESNYSERSGSQDQGGHDRLPSCRVDFVERTGVVVETDSVKLT